MPLDLHPLDQIGNVRWGQGLAVEFYAQTDEEKLDDAEEAASAPSSS